MLRDKEPVVSTVIGFPFGYDTIPTKIMGIEQAVLACAKEIDLVLNLSYVVDERWDLVRAELKDYDRARLNAKLKIIIEVGLVSRAQLAKACELCEQYGVDFIKTSTGYGPRPTEVEDITFIRMCAPNTNIKAAGGINDKEHALALFEAGAHRLGMSKTVEVFAEDPAQLFKNGVPVDEAQA
jgi:deoxyribose-phosphate aldolase